MSSEPPSLAARLEQSGAMHWREAARLTARIARTLDRLHAQGRAHGGLEPLTVLFVAGTVRLADPLPAELPGEADGADAAQGRQDDFRALGRLMLAMLTGGAQATASLPPLPPALAAVLGRLHGGAGTVPYASGNDIAAALELSLAASALPVAAPEQVVAPPPPEAAPPPAFANAGEAGAPLRRKIRRRRGPERMVAVLGGLLLLAGLAVHWLGQTPEPAVEEAREASARGGRQLPAEGEGVAGSAPKPSLEDILEALPDEPLAAPPAYESSRVMLEALLAGLRGRPCSRLEVEPTDLGLRLVGEAASEADRQALLDGVATLDDVDHAMVELDSSGTYCRLYDLLASHAEQSVPRLAELFPRRRDYHLAEHEPLIVRVLTPAFASHLAIDYFAADGMVIHLTKDNSGDDALLPPKTTLRIGDPRDGQWVTIAPPYGRELILVVASEQPLFDPPRARIEPAADYIEALASALPAQPSRPLASTIVIHTGPATP